VVEIGVMGRDWSLVINWAREKEIAAIEVVLLLV
jgi:hypothetical protein